MNYRCVQLATLILAAHCFLAGPTLAAATYFSVPGVDAVDPPQGYPGAMAASSVTIAPNTVTIVKNIDSASPDLVTKVAQGSQLGTTSLLLYNGAPGNSPNTTLNFFNTLATSYSTLDVDTEKVVFNADNPLRLYLEVPGIPGENSETGHPNIMQIESFTFTQGDFRIVKLMDTASDDLILASAQGKVFPVGRLLLYNSLLPQDTPDGIVEFHDLLVSSYQSLGDRREEVYFSFATPVPEPTSLVLTAAGVAFVLFTRNKSVARSFV